MATDCISSAFVGVNIIEGFLSIPECDKVHRADTDAATIRQVLTNMVERRGIGRIAMLPGALFGVLLGHFS